MSPKSSAETIGATSLSSVISSPSSSTAIAHLPHETLSSSHHSRSGSVLSPHQMQSTHVPFQHIEPHLTHQHTIPRQNIVHSQSHANKIEQMQIANSFPPQIEHFDQQTYGNHYDVVHSTMNNSQNLEFNDINYYSNYGASYDDQLRPYSASSNSCSSSNSDGDSSQMTHHHHSSIQTHHNNNQNHAQNRQNHHVSTSSHLTNLHTRDNHSLDVANLSPSNAEYADCMDRSHQTFELNCFGNISNIGIHHFNDDLQANYMHESNQNVIVPNQNGILLNGNASSGGSVLFNGNDLNGPQTITDSIQYTNVIVEPSNFHMTNEYVH